MTKDNAINILSNDDFRAVYIGREFFKELNICSLDEILFILKNVTSDEEVLSVIREINDRMETSKASTENFREKTLQKIIELYQNRGEEPIGSVIADYLAEEVIESPLLKASLKNGSGIPIGENFGYPKELLGDIRKLPINYGNSLFEDMDIMENIKRIRRKEMEARYFPKEESTKPTGIRKIMQKLRHVNK